MVVYIVRTVTSMQALRRCLRPTLDLDSDKFRCFNHRRPTRQRSTASELQIGRDMARAIYSARLAILILYTGLRKPKKRVGHTYQREQDTACKVFARYMRQILYI